MSERQTVDLGDKAAEAARSAASAAALPLEDREAILQEIAEEFYRESRAASDPDESAGGET